MRVLFAAAAVVVALPAWAQTPSPATEAAPDAGGTEVAPDAGTKAAAPGEGRPYVDAALTFLKSFAHTNRPGPQGEEAWTTLRTVAADKVPIKAGGKELTLDAAAGKTDAQLVRFAKLSTWRDGKDVKGVMLDQIELRVGSDVQKGKAKLAMSEKDGKWVVDSIEVE